MAANWAYLDLPTGVAGDMLLAALLDLGVPQQVIDEPLAALGLQSSYRLNVSSGSSAGFIPQTGLALMGFPRCCPSSRDVPNFVVRECCGGAPSPARGLENMVLLGNGFQI